MGPGLGVGHVRIYSELRKIDFIDEDPRRGCKIEQKILNHDKNLVMDLSDITEGQSRTRGVGIVSSGGSWPV